MNPAEREEIVAFAKAHQAAGDILAWAIDEAANKVEFFVPIDTRHAEFPMHFGETLVVLSWIPRAEELLCSPKE